MIKLKLRKRETPSLLILLEGNPPCHIYRWWVSLFNIGGKHGDLKIYMQTCPVIHSETTTHKKEKVGHVSFIWRRFCNKSYDTKVFNIFGNRFGYVVVIKKKIAYPYIQTLWIGGKGTKQPILCSQNITCFYSNFSCLRTCLVNCWWLGDC